MTAAEAPAEQQTGTQPTGAVQNAPVAAESKSLSVAEVFEEANLGSLAIIDKQMAMDQVNNSVTILTELNSMLTDQVDPSHLEEHFRQKQSTHTFIALPPLQVETPLHFVPKVHGTAGGKDDFSSSPPPLGPYNSYELN